MIPDSTYRVWTDLSDIYIVLDWTNNFEAVEITSDEFLSLFNERIGTAISYVLTIQENQIISVTEHYVPWQTNIYQNTF